MTNLSLWDSIVVHLKEQFNPQSFLSQYTVAIVGIKHQNACGTAFPDDIIVLRSSINAKKAKQRACILSKHDQVCFTVPIDELSKNSLNFTIGAMNSLNYARNF